jgi:hypothetical protein
MSFAEKFYTEKGINPHINDNRYNPGRVLTSYNSQENQNAYRKAATRYAEKVKKYTSNYRNATNNTRRLAILKEALINDIHLSDPESIPQPNKVFKATENGDTDAIKELKAEVANFLASYELLKTANEIKQATGEMRILARRIHTLERPEIAEALISGIQKIHNSRKRSQGGRRTQKHRKSRKHRRSHRHRKTRSS